VSEGEAQHGQDAGDESAGKGSRFDGPVGAVGNRGTQHNVAGRVEGDQVSGISQRVAGSPGANVNASQGDDNQVAQVSIAEGATVGSINIEQKQQLKPTGIPHNLPRSNAEFVGRGQDLETLHRQLQRSDRIAISAIAGMGGIGKTELALQYASTHLEQGIYPGGLCWLQARDADVGSQVVTFARTRLGLNLPDGLELPEQVGFCWSHWRQGDALIVFDDVTDYEQIEPFLPPGEKRFKALFTTRKHFTTVEELRLDVLSEDEAIELLGRLAGEERVQGQLEDAKALCQWLGYLPLGLELVGRYLEGKPDLSLARMKERLEAKRLEARALVNPEAGMTADFGVAAAFELSWQELSEAAQQLGCLLSLFALAPIPWSLVESAIELTDEATIPSDAEELEDLRDETLLKLHLLQRTGEGTYQLHQLIREFFIAKQGEADALKQGYCKAMVKAARAIPDTPVLSDIAAVAPSIPHIGEAATALQGWLSDEDAFYPFAGIAWFWEGQGAYTQAQHWKEQCLEVVRDRLGEAHPDVATSLNNLAALYYHQGRYEEAKSLLLQTLQMYKQLSGESHPDVATSLNNLAILYKNQGRYDEAEPLYQKALQMRQQLLGESHPDVAMSLNNLAALYYHQGRYDEAEPLYQKALQMYKQLLGESHPDVAGCLNNLAIFYKNQGRYDEAEPLYQKALQMYKQLLGESHPDVAGCLNNLALLYSDQGRYEQAEPLYLQALQMRQQLLGESHPDVAGCLNNLAILYKNQGRYDEAEPLYQKALQMYKQLLGESHPDVAMSLNNLAALYDNQGRYTEAEPLYLQALQMYKQLSGESHPDVATSLNNLAALYDNQGRYTEAEPLYLQALQMYKQLLGESHPSVAMSLNNLALLYYNQGRYEQAEPLYLQALQMYKQLLGESHPDVAMGLNNLAELHESQERYSEAETLYQKALQIAEQRLGPDHPNTVTFRQNLDRLRNKMSNSDE